MKSTKLLAIFGAFALLFSCRGLPGKDPEPTRTPIIPREEAPVVAEEEPEEPVTEESEEEPEPLTWSQKFGKLGGWYHLDPGATKPLEEILHGKKDKPVFVWLYKGENCPICEKTFDTFLQNSRVKALFKKMIPVHVDVLEYPDVFSKYVYDEDRYTEAEDVVPVGISLIHGTKPLLFFFHIYLESEDPEVYSGGLTTFLDRLIDMNDFMKKRKEAEAFAEGMGDAAEDLWGW